ncbi:MAG TPA: hypothetical protein VKN36_16665, partial [Eudoraea sp.]|nr:hypothetical protein [Eudoraea sp.]
MNLSLRQNIWKSDESGLGFYCVNIIESSLVNPDLKELLKSDILKEREFKEISSISKVLQGNPKYYGAFLKEKIDVTDFEKLDFDGLKHNLSEYWKDKNWGDDLPIFRKNFELAASHLDSFELSNRTFYLINAEKIDLTKLMDPNFFTYFVCIISTEPKSDK